MPSDTTVIFCTCPDQATADRIADTLVDRQLCACVNLIPAVKSIYRWQGKRESTQEVLMLIKTRASRYPALEKAILSMHPYELPEIIAIPVNTGLPGYLNWVEQCTTASC
jgi:periplasmic divalent cation tolerance protein